MSVDTEYHSRLIELADLMKAHPNSRMKKLQKSALRAYPVASRELYRHCMSYHYADKAAQILNDELLASLKEQGLYE